MMTDKVKLAGNGALKKDPKEVERIKRLMPKAQDLPDREERVKKVVRQNISEEKRVLDRAKRTGIAKERRSLNRERRIEKERREKTRGSKDRRKGERRGKSHKPKGKSLGKSAAMRSTARNAAARGAVVRKATHKVVAKQAGKALLGSAARKLAGPAGLLADAYLIGKAGKEGTKALSEVIKGKLHSKKMEGKYGTVEKATRTRKRKQALRGS